MNEKPIANRGIQSTAPIQDPGGAPPKGPLSRPFVLTLSSRPTGSKTTEELEKLKKKQPAAGPEAMIIPKPTGQQPLGRPKRDLSPARRVPVENLSALEKVQMISDLSNRNRELMGKILFLEKKNYRISALNQRNEHLLNQIKNKENLVPNVVVSQSAKLEERQIEEMKIEFKKLQALIETLQETLKDSNERLAKTETELQQSQSLWEHLYKTSGILEKNIRHREEHINDLVEELATLNDSQLAQKTALETELATAQAQLAALTLNLAKEMKEKSAAETKIVACTKERDAVREESARIESKFDTQITSQKIQLEKQNSELVARIIEYERELEDVRVKYETQLVFLRSQLVVDEEKHRALQDDFDAQKTEVAGLVSQVDKMETERDALKNELHTLQTESDAGKKKTAEEEERLKKEVVVKGGEITALETELGNRKSEIERQKDAMRAQLTRLDAATALIQARDMEIAQLNALVQDRDVAIAQLKMDVGVAVFAQRNLECTISQLKDQIKNAEKNLAAVREARARDQKNHSDDICDWAAAEKKIILCEQEITLLKSKLESLEETEKMNEELKKKTRELEETLRKMGELRGKELDAALATIADNQTDLISLRTQINIKNLASADLQSQLTGLQSQLARLQSQNTVLLSKNKKLSEQVKESTKKEGSHVICCAVKNATIATLSSERNNLRSELTDTNARLEITSERLEAAHKELKDADERYGRALAALDILEKSESATQTQREEASRAVQKRRRQSIDAEKEFQAACAESGSPGPRIASSVFNVRSLPVPAASATGYAIASPKAAHQLDARLYSSPIAKVLAVSSATVASEKAEDVNDLSSCSSSISSTSGPNSPQPDDQHNFSHIFLPSELPSFDYGTPPPPSPRGSLDHIVNSRSLSPETPNIAAYREYMRGELLARRKNIAGPALAPLGSNHLLLLNDEDLSDIADSDDSYAASPVCPKGRRRPLRLNFYDDDEDVSDSDTPLAAASAPDTRISSHSLVDASPSSSRGEERELPRTRRSRVRDVEALVPSEPVTRKRKDPEENVPAKPKYSRKGKGFGGKMNNQKFADFNAKKAADKEEKARIAARKNAR